MKTFADYSTHTFKFFYMERGSGSSVCRINFNFPMLKQNSVSVQKELTANANIELLGNPDFRFQILKADENGNKSNDLFIGENVTYTIYDGATNEVLGTGTTGANGVFTLKAGQRAEFEGIQENAGKYYVRELLNKDYFAQYGEISVDGNVITAPTGDITLGSESETFTGMDSPVKDASGGTSVFTFDNQVTVNKLGSLAVSKVLGNASDADAHDREFRILVTLDGKKLPVGTAYTLNDGTTETRRIVTEEGIIPLKAGQTAAISGILAGTRFEVSETSESAEGYVVSYAHTNAADGEISTSGVSGTIGLNTVVGVVVTNSENAASVSIPATKSLSNGSLSSGEHTYSFALQQISAKDADGNTLEGFADDSQTETVEVTGSDVTQFAFGLKYAAAQFDADTAFPVTVTYEIRELAEGVTDAITDPAVYTAQVTISKDAAGGIRAALTSLKKGETEVSDQTAAFVNTLTGDLTLKKQVEGGENAKEREFTFQVTLQNSSGEPLAGQTVLYTIGETTHTVTTDADGAFTLEGIRHETEVVIRDLPLGTQWIITETNVQSYLVSWTANGTSGSSHVAAGNIPDGGMSVVYTNTSTYILPETGGGGTIPYTVAGLVLICFSMAYLMYYRSKARGRGSYRSP